MSKTLRDENVSLLKSKFDGIAYAETAKGITGKLNSDGTVNPDVTEGLDRPYIWVRVGENTQAVRAANVKVANVPNLRVRLARDRNSEWEVLELDGARSALDIGELAPTMAVPDRIGDLVTETVNPERFKPFQLYIISDYTVGVRPGVYQKPDGTWVEFVGDSIDLTSSVPATASRKKAVLVGINLSTGALTSYAGSEVDVKTPPRRGKLFDYEDYATLLNAATAGVFWVGGVAIAESDAAIDNYERFTALQLFEQGRLHSLDDHSDTDLSSPVNGDVVTWNNSTSKWEATAPSGGGATVKVSATDTTADYLDSTLVMGSSKITKTTLNPAADEQIELDVDASAVVGATSVGAHSDVTLTSPAFRDVIYHDGAKWINQQPTLSGLADASVSSPAAGQSLRYSGSVFVNSLIQSITPPGRLTLSSSESVPTSDVSAATTLYYLPHADLANNLWLYDGSNWKPYDIGSSGISLSLSGTSATTVYDVFCYASGSTPTLELTAWSSASARATSLAKQNGIYVKSGTTTRRYLGTIYIETANQCDDSAQHRHVWNYYNRVSMRAHVIETTQHTYASATWRQWNSNSTVYMSLVRGVDEGSLIFSNVVDFKADTSATARVSLGFDTTTSFSYAACRSDATTRLRFGFPEEPSSYLGYHKLNVVESGGGSTGCTYYSVIAQAYMEM